MEHMGHFINVFDFKKTDNLKKDKEEIFFEAEDWGDYESNTRKYHGNLSFKTDTVFETRSDAERYLKQFHGHLKDVAVIYKHREDSATKKIEKKEEKLRKLFEQLTRYWDDNLLSKRKSKTVSCPKCGSVLNIKYLTKKNKATHNCPLCKEELLSKRVMDRIRKFNRDIRKLDDEIEEEKEKVRNSQTEYELRWLVKVEVHV